VGASGDGTFATFLKKLEAVLGKIVLDNWENGLPEHKVRAETRWTCRVPLTPPSRLPAGKGTQGAGHLDQSFDVQLVDYRQNQLEAARDCQQYRHSRSARCFARPAVSQSR
jgi:hypothetical protein